MRPSRPEVLRPDQMADGKWGHPRPTLFGPWQSLNGVWEYAEGPPVAGRGVEGIVFDRRINVPFAPETAASGINSWAEGRELEWVEYRRTVDFTPGPGMHKVLHFEAVDHEAWIFLDGQPVPPGGLPHEGGYARFSIDVTAELERLGIDPNGEHLLTVVAHDDMKDPFKNRGKQDNQNPSHDIDYSASTGIRDQVWMEDVGPVHFTKADFVPHLDGRSLDMHLSLAGDIPPGSTVDVEIRHRSKVVKRSTVSATSVVVSDLELGDDLPEGAVWRPEQPELLNVLLTVVSPNGEVLDRKGSYTAMREWGIDAEGFHTINGARFMPMGGLLQGYHKDTDLTPDGDQAMIRLIRNHKSVFNHARLHQHAPPERFLYLCDRMGLPVSLELPSAHDFDERSQRLSKETWTAMVRRDCTKPSLMELVPVNERRGMEQVHSDPRQAEFARELYELTRAVDIHGHVICMIDGDNVDYADKLGLHLYSTIEELEERLSATSFEQFMAEVKEGEHVAVHGDATKPSSWAASHGRTARQVVALTEWGGWAIGEQPLVHRPFVGAAADDPDVFGTEEPWGYGRPAADRNELTQWVLRGRQAIRNTPWLRGNVYTQSICLYQERNGLFDEDYVPRVDVQALTRDLYGTDFAPSAMALAPEAAFPAFNLGVSTNQSMARPMEL